jgi:hypothetical protein
MTSRQLTLDKEHCGKEVHAYTMSKTTEAFPIDLSRVEPLNHCRSRDSALVERYVPETSYAETWTR